jgi:hypothetical protein
MIDPEFHDMVSGIAQNAPQHVPIHVNRHAPKGQLSAAAWATQLNLYSAALPGSNTDSDSSAVNPTAITTAAVQSHFANPNAAPCAQVAFERTVGRSGSTSGSSGFLCMCKPQPPCGGVLGYSWPTAAEQAASLVKKFQTEIDLVKREEEAHCRAADRRRAANRRRKQAQGAGEEEEAEMEEEEEEEAKEVEEEVGGVEEVEEADEAGGACILHRRHLWPQFMFTGKEGVFGVSTYSKAGTE